MAKLQQAEAEHLRDKVQMKRELDQQHRRASSLEHRYSQVQVILPSQLTWHQLGPFFNHHMSLRVLSCEELETH